jgi:hypothetical protein
MTTLLFDCETNGLLDKLDRVHSLVIKDADTGQVKSACHPFPGSADTHYCDVDALLMWMQEADELVGHNIIRFDIPALQKVYPWFTPKARLLDTLIYARLLWPDIGDSDVSRMRKGRLPGKLIGLHKLEAWGYRLGKMKGDYSEIKKARLREQHPDLSKDELNDMVWAEWDPEMQEYCEQDVDVTEALWRRCQAKLEAMHA